MAGFKKGFFTTSSEQERKSEALSLTTSQLQKAQPSFQNTQQQSLISSAYCPTTKKLYKRTSQNFQREKNMKKQYPESAYQGKRKFIPENSEIQPFEEFDPIADQNQLMNLEKEIHIKIITEL